MVTRDRLLRWGLSVPKECLLCVGHDETRQHLFFDCSYSSQVWSYFLSKLHLTAPQCFEEGLRWLKNPSRDKNVKLIVRLLHQACLYLIWKERNARLHSDLVKQPQAIIAEIKNTLRLRLDPIARSQHMRGEETSVLATWLGFF